MKIGIIAEQLDSFRQQTITAIVQIGASYGHLVTVHTRASSSQRAGTGKQDLQADEAEYVAALPTMDALIAFSVRERDFAAGHAPHVSMVIILDERSVVDQLQGSVRCIWTDYRQALAQAFAYACTAFPAKQVILYASERPKPIRPMCVPTEMRPSPIGQPHPKRASRSEVVQIRYIQTHPRSVSSVSQKTLQGFKTMVYDDVAEAESVKKRSMKTRGNTYPPIMCAVHSLATLEKGSPIPPAITRFDFNVQEVAYQALFACELPRPAQPQIVHVEPRLIPEEPDGP